MNVFGRADHSDIDALVSSELFGDRNFPVRAWFSLDLSLLRALSGDYYPVSDATRSKVIESLVIAGCSDNPALASPALWVLITAGDGNRVDIGPFLTDERKQTLIRNYLALITEDSVEQGRAAFESRLGLRPD